MIRKLGLGLAALMLVVAAIELSPITAHAKKVDCTKVMSEFGAGKKAKDIAKDLGISTSSVYRCRRRASASKAGTTKTAAATAPAATAPPKK